MSLKRTFLTGAVCFALFACEELFFIPEPENTPTGIFGQAWVFADEEYSFFEYKGIDWDAAKAVYEAQITDDMGDEALFQVLATMLNQLRDGHVNLTSDFDRSRNWKWYLDYQPNYDFDVLERYYFQSEEQYIGGALILFDFSSPSGDVGYIHYRSFMNAVSSADMDYVIEKFKDHKGLIIDLRNNTGGIAQMATVIGNRLTDTRVAVAEEQFKNGPGHDDFTAKATRYFEPPVGASTYTKPIVILTNRRCYSATNFFVTMASSLDHVTIMGDKTGGGGGYPANTVLTNGWELRVSSSRLFLVDDGSLTEDQRNVEDGVEPDVSVSSTESELATGVDNILDTAIAYIRGL
ncbi:MAG: peptidase S41 [Spirochaetales bacterium]|nr:peptidase S41 [Spirochaetales bacterium]